MNKTQTYVLTGIAALTLNYTTPAQEINNEVKTQRIIELDSIKEKYHAQRDKATTLWNKAIADNKLSFKEQVDILKTYEKSEQAREHYNKNITHFRPQAKHIPQQEDIYFTLMDKNLYRWDTGTPELEKQLNKEGFNVDVENSSWEILKIGFITLATVVFGVYGLMGWMLYKGY